MGNEEAVETGTSVELEWKIYKYKLQKKKVHKRWSLARFRRNETILADARKFDFETSQDLH